MLTIIKLGLDFLVFLLVFTAGIKFDQKWPGGTKQITFVWNVVEKILAWIWGMFKSTTSTVTK